MSSCTEATVPIRAARKDDLGALIDLVGQVVPECHPETVWQLPWSWPTYVVVDVGGGRLAAAGSLQPLDGRRAEIRGLVVGRDFRGRGLASEVVRRLVEIGEARGLEIVCVTRKRGFFAKLGFEDTRLDWMRPERRAGARRSDADRIGMVARNQPRGLA